MKRGNERGHLSKEEYARAEEDEEDGDGGEDGTFQKADADAMSKRKIVRARRFSSTSTGGTGDDSGSGASGGNLGAAKNPFSNFSFASNNGGSGAAASTTTTTTSAKPTSNFGTLPTPSSSSSSSTTAAPSLSAWICNNNSSTMSSSTMNGFPTVGGGLGRGGAGPTTKANGGGGFSLGLGLSGLPSSTTIAENLAFNSAWKPPGDTGPLFGGEAASSSTTTTKSTLPTAPAPVLKLPFSTLGSDTDGGSKSSSNTSSSSIYPSFALGGSSKAPFPTPSSSASSSSFGGGGFSTTGFSSKSSTVASFPSMNGSSLSSSSFSSAAAAPAQPSVLGGGSGGGSRFPSSSSTSFSSSTSTTSSIPKAQQQPSQVQGGSAGGGGGAATVKSGGGGIGGGSNNKLGDRMLQLNKGFAKWLSEQINKNPYSTWVDGVQDYIKYARSLEKKYGCGAGGQQGQQSSSAGHTLASKVPATSDSGFSSVSLGGGGLGGDGQQESKGASTSTMMAPPPQHQSAAASKPAPSSAQSSTFQMPFPTLNSLPSLGTFPPLGGGSGPSFPTTTTPSTPFQYKPVTLDFNKTPSATPPPASGGATSGGGGEGEGDDEMPLLEPDKAEKHQDPNEVMEKDPIKTYRLNKETKQWTDMGKGSLALYRQVNQPSKAWIAVRNLTGKVMWTASVHPGMQFSKLSSASSVAFACKPVTAFACKPVTDGTVGEIATIRIKVKDGLDQLVDKLEDLRTGKA